MRPDFHFIATDPIVMMQAHCAVSDMGRKGHISALLLDGPPGVGKSYLAQFLAWSLEARLIRFPVFPGCGQHELLFDLRFGKEGQSHGILLQAIESSKTVKTILLLDELDKTDESVDAFLLTFLQDAEINLAQMGIWRADTGRLLVVITKNDQREASAALQRRCRVAQMMWPAPEVETEILHQAFPFLPTDRLASFLETPNQLRTCGIARKPPSTPELVRAVGDILELIPFANRMTIGLYFASAITTYPEDRKYLLDQRSAVFYGTRMMELFGDLCEDLPGRSPRPIFPLTGSS